MTINFYRLPGEAPAHPDATKENATAGNRGAAGKANQTDPHSTRETSRETERERGLYLPLAWMQRGRMGGNITAELAGLILLAAVAGVLLLGGA